MCKDMMSPLFSNSRGWGPREGVSALVPHGTFLSQSWQRLTFPVSFTHFISQMFLHSKAKANSNCSFSVKRRLHLSPSLLPAPLQAPQLHGSQMQNSTVSLQYLHEHARVGVVLC